MPEVKEKLIVTSSPHVGSALTTKKIMLHVIIALCFPLIAGVVLYGFYALFVVLLAVASSVGSEWFYNLIRKKPDTTGDLSAIVTGMILGLNLPPTVPFYVPLIGGIVAIMLVKMLFGGLGKNFAHPAATARVFLLLAGTIGETCKIALIASLIYLLIFKIIDWKIPVGYFLSVAFFSLVFYKDGWNFILPNLMSGGVMFAGIFMLTDYTTSPDTRLGTWIFAVGAGLMTLLIRRYGGMNEGASFAVLLMNLLVPLIDKGFKSRPFGYKKPPKKPKGEAV